MKFHSTPLFSFLLASAVRAYIYSPNVAGVFVHQDNGTFYENAFNVILPFLPVDIPGFPNQRIKSGITFLAGIDDLGYCGATVAAGIDCYVSRNTVAGENTTTMSYTPWYQVTGERMYISGVAMSPGDEIRVTITIDKDSSRKGWAYITNKSNGQSNTPTEFDLTAGFCGSSVTWQATSYGDFPVASFDVAFTEAAAFGRTDEVFGPQHSGSEVYYMELDKVNDVQFQVYTFAMEYYVNFVFFQYLYCY